MRLLLSGQMRSGTTFLSNLLSSQEEIIIYPDFLHIVRLKEEAGVKSLVEKLSLEQKQAVVDRFYGISDGCMAITNETGTPLDFRVDPSSFNSLIEFYDQIFLQMGSLKHTVVGHKSTESEGGVQELLELCPDLKCLYIVRDPRDVLISNKHMMGQANVLVLEHWQLGVNEILRIKKLDQLSSRILIIRYEDLVRMPETTLSKIADFLELKNRIIPKPLTWYEQHYISNSSFGDIKQMFDTKGVDRWKGNASWIPALAVRLVSQELVQLGYESYEPSFYSRWQSSLILWWHSNRLVRKLVKSIVSFLIKCKKITWRG